MKKRDSESQNVDSIPADMTDPKARALFAHRDAETRHGRLGNQAEAQRAKKEAAAIEKGPSKPEPVADTTVGEDRI